MAHDDYFKLVYVILTELYACKRANSKVRLETIGYKRFRVPEGYLLDILADLRDEGYTKSYDIAQTKTGRYIIGLEDIAITMKGIEYLQDNAKMKQVYKLLKEVRDWVPGL